MIDADASSAAKQPDEPTHDELSRALQSVINDSEIWRPRILMSAVELGVFDAIDQGTVDSDTLARRIGANRDGIFRLLRALQEMGYVEHAQEGYSNTLASKYFLCKSSPYFMGSWFRLNAMDWPAWGELTEAIRSGRPPTAGSIFADPERLGVLLHAAHERARLFHVQELLATLDLSGVGRFLDLGGGAGTYSMALCEANPGTHATIFDLPAAIAIARKVVSRSSAASQIDFVEGDFTAGPLGGPFDMVFVSNVLHGEAPDAAQRLIEKAYSALGAGGRLVIRDSFLKDDGTNALSGAVFSLTLMVETVAGRTYRNTEVREMLIHAGFNRIEEMSDKLMIGCKDG